MYVDKWAWNAPAVMTRENYALQTFNVNLIKLDVVGSICEEGGHSVWYHNQSKDMPYEFQYDTTCLPFSCCGENTQIALESYWDLFCCANTTPTKQNLDMLKLRIRWYWYVQVITDNETEWLLPPPTYVAQDSTRICNICPVWPMIVRSNLFTHRFSHSALQIHIRQ